MCNKYAPPKVTHDSAFVQEQRNPFSTCWHSVFFNWFFSKLIESRPKKSSYLMQYVQHTYWRLSVSWLAQLRYIFVEANEYLTSVFLCLPPEFPKTHCMWMFQCCPLAWLVGCWNYTMNSDSAVQPMQCTAHLFLFIEKCKIGRYYIQTA